MSIRSKLASILLVAMTLFVSVGAVTYSAESYASGNRGDAYS